MVLLYEFLKARFSAGSWSLEVNICADIDKHLLLINEVFTFVKQGGVNI